MKMAETVAWLQKDGGWGGWVKVTVADTPEADAAAAAFFRRASTLETRHAAAVDEELSTALGPKMAEIFYPTCEHGMDGNLCAGPDHFLSAEQERMLGL